MARNKRLVTVEDLWKFERIGGVALSPDGAQAVCSVASYSMDENKGQSSLWLLSTFGGGPRRLTHCGEKDGQAAWSPTGERIAFVARREQQGKKDETPQLYVIAPDGGEARRVSDFAPGIEAFKWLPDGKRIAFVAWVWPELKGTAAQASAASRNSRSARKRATSPARRSTATGITTCRWAAWRTCTCWTWPPAACATCSRARPWSCRAPSRTPNSFDIVARRPAHRLRARPGRREAPGQLQGAGRDQPAHPPRRDAGARQGLGLRNCRATAPTAGSSHSSPATRGQAHDAGAAGGADPRRALEGGQRRLGPRRARPAALVRRRRALFFTAEDRGRNHLWRFELRSRSATRVVARRLGAAFDVAADPAGDVVVTAADAMDHPARVHAARGRAAPRRLERFNDELLAHAAPGHARGGDASRVPGRAGADVGGPPAGFRPKRKKYPVLHWIHGGPHAAAGDTFHYRWNNHVFAAQGYVVACVNYHGSSGFG